MSYVSALQDKRKVVWSELEGLRGQQRELGDRIGMKEAQLRNLDELLALEGEPASTKFSSELPRPTSAGFLDAAADLLRDRDAGTHYQEVLKLLTSSGVNVPGRDPAANLIAHMGRDDRFVRTGRGTYGLRAKHHAAPATRRRISRKSVRKGKVPK